MVSRILSMPLFSERSLPTRRILRIISLLEIISFRRLMSESVQIASVLPFPISYDNRMGRTNSHILPAIVFNECSVLFMSQLYAITCKSYCIFVYEEHKQIKPSRLTLSVQATYKQIRTRHQIYYNPVEYG